MRFAFVLLLSVCACKENQKVDMTPVKIKGFATCKPGPNVNLYQYPILVEFTRKGSKHTAQVSGATTVANDAAAAQDATVMLPKQKADWTVKAGVCPNKMEMKTGAYECGTVTDWYHTTKFSYDPKNPASVTMPPPKRGTPCLY